MNFKSVLALLLVAFIAYNFLSTGKEIKESSEVLGEIKDQRSLNRRLKPVSLACRNEGVDNCAEYSTLPEILACVRLLDSVSERCESALQDIEDLELP